MANTIDGRLISARTRKPIPHVRVEAFCRQLRGDEPIGSAVTNEDGAFSIQVDERLYARLLEAGLDVEFRLVGPEGAELETVERVLWNARLADQRIVIVVRDDVVVPGPDPAGLYDVQGVVTSNLGVALSGVRVEALDHDLGEPTVLGATSTGADGHYSIVYQASALGGKTAADLQVRAVADDRQRTLLATSRVLFQADQHEVRDLVVAADAAPRASELQRLTDAVRPIAREREIGGLDADNVTYLAGRTGWDARSIAMASRATQLSAETEIPADHYYALLRLGLSADPSTLHRLSDEHVAAGLKAAIEAGIIDDSHPIDDTIARHREAAAKVLMSTVPVGAISSLGDMLALRLDPDRRNSFVEAYRATSGDPDQLWSSLASAGFDDEIIDRLQTDAALGQLTAQNAPVVARLTDQGVVKQVSDLAAGGFYDEGAWRDIVGDDHPEGVEAADYASGLAAQVRLTYPTLVTADLVRRDELALAEPAARAEVTSFLADHGDFALGVHPVHTWAGFEDLSSQARLGVKQVERLYQMSPSNESMMALSQLGLDSAMKVMSYSPDGFVAKFGGELPEGEALKIYNKASEIHSTSLNVATMYLLHRSAPNLYVLTGKLAREDVETPPEIAASATLEELFSNLDYCACEACKSVLSPAAYYVELLEFIDLSDLPHTKANPIEVLLGRRPDLQHLLLTCENTNVALPYLDLVNEVLEHYIVNGNLTGFTGHNTSPDAVTADLLADPQFVEDAAYDATLAEVSPFSLPFDMPLAHLRLLFQVWDTTLADALSTFGAPAEARRERLALNDPELKLLTDTTFHTLPEYFGEPAGGSIDALNDAIATGKAFCRRTGITYAQLADLLSARFVNPGIVVVPLLRGLGLTLDQIKQHADGAISDDDLRDLLPDDFDETPYGGDVIEWLATNIDLVMRLVTLIDTGDEPGECDFGKVELRYALPDMANNRLTELSYHRLHRFIRIWKKLGWSIDLTDAAVAAFLGVPADSVDMGNLDATCTQLLARVGNFLTLLSRASIAPKRIPEWLALWDQSIDVATRQARLAKLVKFGATDLTHLIEITGIDPLTDDMHADEPSMLRFVALAAAVKGSPLKVVDLDYLLRHDDLNGKLTPREQDVRRDLKMLRDGLTVLEADLSVAPSTADLPSAQAKMGLVYDAATVARFFGLIDRTTTYSAPLTTAEPSLPASLAAIAPDLTIDSFAQALTVRGVLAEATRVALAAAADALTLGDVEEITVQGDLDQFVTDVKTALQQLRAAGLADLSSLGDDHPELEALHDAVQAIAEPAARAAMIVTAILPELRASLRATSIRNGLVASTKADLTVIDALTSGADVLGAATNPADPVLADFFALDTPVVFNADQTWSFFLDPPANDLYVLIVRAPAGAHVTLSVDGAEVIPDTAVGVTGELRAGAPVSLSGGALTPAELTLTGLGADDSATVLWQTKAIAKQPVPASRLANAAVVAEASASLIRLHKAVLLQRSLGLTAAEIVHVAAEQSTTKGVFDALDVDGTIGADDLHAQWVRIESLLALAAIKRDHEQEPDSVVGVLRQPDATNAQGRLVIAGIMEWSETDLAAVLAGFGLAQTDLGELPVLRRVQGALDLVATTLQPAADLIAWSVADPDGPLVRGIVDTVRDRMSAASWQETMKSVSDELRNQRRDALGAYILHHHPPAPQIETLDHLYEYFLIDVQMDACMQTSRIRQALSTVQLFITRCLMNLELDVSPDSIRHDQWEWMKRYRVWEANRKIFLYPENWLEPELRDNKSPFFRDLESELLKADITDEAAENAYLSYLKKLDDVARLEIVGAFLQEQQSGNPDDDILHVFGRAGGATREHYYRRFEYGYWTAWEKVGLNIESDLLFPVIWRRQLFVFWFTSVSKPIKGDTSKSPQDLADESWGNTAKVDVEITLHWGEYFHGKWTSPKSTEMRDPIRITNLPSFDPAKVVLSAHTFKPSANVSERLVFSLIYLDGSLAGHTVTFTSKNSPPFIGSSAFEDQALTRVETLNYTTWWGSHPEALLDTNSLVYPNRVLDARVEQPANASEASRTEVVLTKTSQLLPGFRMRPVLHPTENNFETPFFYSDEHSVFFVSCNETVESQPRRYYVDDFIPKYDGFIKEIPKLYETPVKPIIPKPGDPVIDPWVEVLDPYTRNVISDNNVFEFGGATFDAKGRVGLSEFQ